jgi:hypothetical protein
MKSKYEPGQEVWVIVDGAPKKMEIITVTISKESIYYNAGRDTACWEDQIYPTQEALIDAEIAYWMGMKNDNT